MPEVKIEGLTVSEIDSAADEELENLEIARHDILDFRQRARVPRLTAARFESRAKGTFNDSREFCGILPHFSVLSSERRLQRPPHPSFKLA